MLHRLIEELSNRPRFFLSCRGLLEVNFTVIRRTIQHHLGTGENRRVLDVACGPGAFSDLFTAERYMGIDLNTQYITYANKNYRGAFEVQDARALAIADGTFDDALVYGLLHHLGDDDVSSVAREVKRVLRPGGRVLVIEDIPIQNSLNFVGHLLHWAENGNYIRPADEYRRLLTPYFRVVDEKLFRSGVCDYFMASLVADGDAPETESGQDPAP